MVWSWLVHFPFLGCRWLREWPFERSAAWSLKILSPRSSKRKRLGRVSGLILCRSGEICRTLYTLAKVGDLRMIDFGGRSCDSCQVCLENQSLVRHGKNVGMEDKKDLGWTKWCAVPARTFSREKKWNGSTLAKKKGGSESLIESLH